MDNKSNYWLVGYSSRSVFLYTLMLLSALRVAIEWGRYGDLFEYDFNTGILNMPKNDGTSAE